MNKPAGWEIVRLGDVVVSSSERASPEQFPTARFIGFEHIQADTQRLVGFGVATDVKSTKAVFRAGDVLYGKLRPYLRKVCRPDFDGLCSTDILVFPKMAALDGGYLLHFLSRQSTAAFAMRNATGVNIPRVTPQALAQIDFPLAPLAEQRRIAAKIDAIHNRLLHAQDVLSELGALSGHLGQSILAAAFRGDLSSDVRHKPSAESGSDLLRRIAADRTRHSADLGRKRGQAIPVAGQSEPTSPTRFPDSQLPQLPTGWSWATAADIVEPGADIVYGIIQPGEPVTDGIPYVRAKDIQNGTIRQDQLLRTRSEIARAYDRSALKGGDVLLGIIRATKVAIVPDSLAGGNITQGTARFRPSSVIRTGYLAYWLSSPFAQTWLHDRYRGIDMPGLNLRDVRRVPVPLAPLHEQLVIEERVGACLKTIVAVDNAVASAFDVCNQLHKAVLEKAFRGELLPQEPSDEPASCLITHIQNERTAMEQREKAARSDRKNTTSKTRASVDDAVRELLNWIQQHPRRTFTFDELRQDLHFEYEIVKEAVFKMLGSEEGSLRQVFNETARQIEFQGGPR